MKEVFNSEGYINEQYSKINEQIGNFGKLYLELGGKLFDDNHASRVIPGFMPDTKLKIIEKFKNCCEIIICINSSDIQKGRIRSDYNTLYVDDCLKLIGTYRSLGFLVSGVVLTSFKGQEKAVEFKNLLEEKGENVYSSRYIQDYPNNFEFAEDSFKKSDYIKTSRPLVVMSSSGSASGKLSACLCQIYKEFNIGNKVGYLKLDIFPVWNYPVNHPINLAFMAATADSDDKIIVDTYYKKKYNEDVSNYNRDMVVFPLIHKVLTMANGGIEMYSSPTEMVFNPLKKYIIDEDVVVRKCKEEICRRFFTYKKQFSRGESEMKPVENVLKIMKSNEITLSDLKIIDVSRKFFKNGEGKNLAVLQLNDDDFCYFEEKDGNSIDKELLKTIFSLAEVSEFYVDRLSFDEQFYILKQFDFFEDLKQLLFNLNMHTSYCVSKEVEENIKKLGINLTCEVDCEKKKILQD